VQQSLRGRGMEEGRGEVRLEVVGGGEVRLRREGGWGLGGCGEGQVMRVE
jgi:hypothetical protein